MHIGGILATSFDECRNQCTTLSVWRTVRCGSLGGNGAEQAYAAGCWSPLELQLELSKAAAFGGIDTGLPDFGGGGGGGIGGGGLVGAGCELIDSFDDSIGLHR